ncbi:ribokinase [Pseudoflavonifractor sp. MSJ-30]|uniref:ribokinase n=1 Tax=Pseudoflavonifractor sp. MSJ-30 TaxID=2841525 RepID=UPI00209F0516|nr:ribokinase [Pseudoflavonifractor sp. MSJ-30]
MSKPRILVVGSLVMDQIGIMPNLPAEGETIFGTSFQKAPGGKGANQAAQMALLGAEVVMCGKVGLDSNGDEMLRALQERGVDVQHVFRDRTAASGCSMIILEEDEQGSRKNRIIVIPGSNFSLQKEELTFLEDTIASYDLVVLQLEIPQEVNEYVAHLAHAQGVPVLLNPAPSAPLSSAFLRDLTYIAPNEHEAAALSGLPVTTSEDSIRRCAEFFLAQGVPNVIITLGSAGAALAAKEGIQLTPCAAHVRSVDPTAAGDSFIGAFAVGVCCGWDIPQTLLFANHTAGLTVSSMGAMPSLPNLAQVEAFLRRECVPVPDLSDLR